MTVSLEKIFFNYILLNPKFYEIVENSFFKNEELKFVYAILRKYMLSNGLTDTPKPRQILEMVLLEDMNGIITKESLKSMLKVDMSEYDNDNFIIPRFNARIIANRIGIGTSEIIDVSREITKTNDLDNIMNLAGKIKFITDNMTNDSFIKNDEDLGSDFEDAENHTQDSSVLKVKTGYNSVDHILGGGWDVATLNIIMGMTNAGKCVSGKTKIKIKVGGVEEEVSIEDLYNRIKV